MTVTGADDADRHSFAGSPTFRAASADLFPAARQPAGLAAASTGPGPRRAVSPTCRICGGR